MFRMSNRKVLLMILDGWGIGDGQKGMSSHRCILPIFRK